MKAAQGFAIAGLLACLGGPAWAAGYSCPASVMDKGAVKSSDGRVDPPWALHNFRFAQLYEGDPKQGAALTPGEELKEDKLVQTWSLDRAPEGPVTLVCRYSGTSQTVHVALSGSIARCILVTMKSGDPPPALRCE
jgi:hypothetical protein